MLGRENRLEGVCHPLKSTSQQKRLRALRITSAALVAMCGLVGTTSAASLTWDSSAANPTNPVDGSGTWNTTLTNWSNGTSDVAWSNATNSTAIFGNGGVAGNITVGTGITVGGMTFNPVIGTYNIASGSGITLSGTSPALFTMNSNAIIAPAIGGTSGLTVSGTGTLIFGTTEAYTGLTTINSGATLQLGTATTSGGTLQSTSAIVDNGTYILNRGTTVTPLISGSGNVIMMGAGTTSTFNQVNTYTGTTSITGGTLALAVGANVSPSSGLILGGGAAGTDTLSITTGRTAGSVVFNGTTVNAGDNVIAAGANLGSTSNTLSLGVITRNTGGILDFGTLPTTGTITTTTPNANITGGQQTILGGYAFVPGAGQDANWAVSGSGATAGTISGLTTYGTLTSGADVLGGGTVASPLTINSLKNPNALTINAPLTIATGGVLIANVGASTQNLTGTGSITSGSQDLNFILTSNAGTPLNIAVPIVDNGGPVGLTLGVSNGNLSATLSASNTFSGDTNINAVSGGNTTSITLTNPLALQNSTVNYSSGGNSHLYFGNTANPLASATLGGLKGFQNLTVQNSSSGAVAIPLSIGNNNQNTTYSGVLTSTGVVNKIGSGTWTLGGVNAISGNLNINTGTLKLTGTGSIASTPLVTIAPGAFFDTTALNAGAYTAGASQTITGTGTISGSMVLPSGSQLFPGGSAVGTLSTGNLNFSSGSIINEMFGTPGTTASPGTSGLISVTGNITLPATGVKLNLFNNSNNNSQGSLEAGVYDILNYTGSLNGFASGASGVGSFTVITTPLNGRTYTFSNNAVTKQIDLTVGAGTSTLTWTGNNNGSWDTSTANNWVNGTTPATYADPNSVIFGDGPTNTNITIKAGGVSPATVTFNNNNATYSFSNAGGDTVGINGPTGIVKNGSGTVNLNSANSFSGPVALNSGIINISNGNALGSIGALSGTTVANGAALQMQGNITTNAQPLTLNGTGVSLSGALNNLSGSNTYAGPIALASPSTIGAAGGTLTLSGGVATGGNALTISGNGNVNINSGAVSGSGSLSYTGNGTLALGSASSYTGGTSIQSGTVSFASPNSFGASSSPVNVQGNATLQATGSISMLQPVSIGGGITATIDTQANSLTLNGVAGGGGINKIGPGSLTLKGTNTYGGSTVVSNGTLVLANIVSNAALQVDPTKLTGPAVSTVNNLGTQGGSFTSSSTPIANAINGHQALVFNGSAATALLSGNAFTDTGTGLTEFVVESAAPAGGYTGEVSYNGPVGGADWTGSPANLATDDGGAGTQVNVSRNGATLTANRPSGGAQPIVWDATYNGSGALLNLYNSSGGLFSTATGTSTGNFNISTMALGGRLSPGIGSFFTGNLGEVLVFNTALSATDRASVESYLQSKWLGVGTGTVTGNLPVTTPLQIATGGTLDMNGVSQQVGSLSNSGSGGGTITNNGSTNSVLSIATASSATFGGVIKDGAAGTVGLTINGTGTQTLTGANNYSGPTTILSGKLIVSAGGTLGNTPVSVANSGVFAPQPGSSTMTIASLNLSNGSTFDMTDGSIGTVSLSSTGTALKIGSGIGAASTLNFDLSGTGVDKIIDSGAAAVVGTNTINITELGSNLTGGTYTLISATSGLGGSFQFSNGGMTEAVTAGGTPYNLSLVNSGTAESLIVQQAGVTSAWTGAVNTTWANAGNWSGNVPGSIGTISNPDTVVFNSNPANRSPIVDAGRNVQNITFDTGSVGPVNLTGATLTLSANGTTQATSSVNNDETISVPLVLEGNYAFLSNSNNNNALALNGNITGGTAAGSMIMTLGGSSTGLNIIAGSISNGSATSLGILKIGSGNWVLAHSNSYTGDTNINAGVLTVVNDALGSSGNVVFNGGTLQYATVGANQDLSSRINNSTDVISIDTNGNNVNFAGSLAATNLNGLTKLGAGTLTLSGANAYVGPTNVSGGSLNLANNGALGASSSLAVANGAAVQLSGNTIIGAVPLSVAGNGVSASPAGVIDNLNGSNTYAGAITVRSDSTLQSDSGSLTLSGSVTGSNTNLTLTGGGNGTISGAIATGNGQVTMNGTGIWLLTGANTFTGGVVLNSGVVQINSATSLGDVTGTAGINAATLEATASFSTSRNFSLYSSSSTIQVDSGSTYSIRGQINGSGNLNKTGAGTLVLNGSNYFYGGTTISAGTLQVGSTQALGSSSVTLAAAGTTLRLLPAPILGADGFGGTNHNGVTLKSAGNGSPPSVSSSNVLTLTTGDSLNQNRAAWQNSAVTFDSGFTASFVYQGGNGANGEAFVLQNSAAGTNALGGIGGSLGYTSGGQNGTPANDHSVALGWNVGGTSTIEGGQADPTAATTTALFDGAMPTGSVALNSGDPILFNVTGIGSSNLISFTLTDQTNSNTYSGSVALTNTLSNILGGSTALVGFTASTSGGSQLQTISNFSFTNPFAGSFAVNNTVNVNADSTIDVSYTAGAGVGPLNVNGHTLTITNSAGSGVATLLTNSLTNTGKIDITSNALDVQNGDINAITNQVKAAYSNGTWTGTNINGVITSSNAASDPRHLTAVGIATGLSSFEGQNVSTGDVLIKYTYYGDSNLDGKVDGSDYSRIDNGYLNSLTGWYNGDFNYDGVIDGSDYTLIDNAFNTQGTVLAADIANPTVSIASELGASAAVPEPTTLGLLGIAVVGLLGRRKQRRM